MRRMIGIEVELICTKKKHLTKIHLYTLPKFTLQRKQLSPNKIKL